MLKRARPSPLFQALFENLFHDNLSISLLHAGTTSNMSNDYLERIVAILCRLLRDLELSTEK